MRLSLALAALAFAAAISLPAEARMRMMNGTSENGVAIQGDAVDVTTVSGITLPGQAR